MSLPAQFWEAKALAEMEDRPAYLMTNHRGELFAGFERLPRCRVIETIWPEVLYPELERRPMEIKPTRRDRG